MTHYWISLHLQSDATFGRGDGIPGLVDREVEHDRLGLPFLRGRTLKGLLAEEADNLLFLLQPKGETQVDGRWLAARQALLGRPGSGQHDRALVHYGHARLPDGVYQAVRASNLSRERVLESVTALRRQTAVVEDGLEDGVPAKGSLRAMRVILRDTDFYARLTCRESLGEDALALLAAAVLVFRRAGTGRNRGRGRLVADLLDADYHSILWRSAEHFIKEAL